MKVLLVLFLLVLNSVAAVAGEKMFSKADYAAYVKDGALGFTLVGTAKKDVLALRLDSNECDKAIFASIAAKAFELAENDGVDYPEEIGVYEIKDVSPMPGIEMVKVRSDDDLSYVVRYFPSNVPCLAEPSNVSGL